MEAHPFNAMNESFPYSGLHLTPMLREDFLELCDNDPLTTAFLDAACRRVYTRAYLEFFAEGKPFPDLDHIEVDLSPSSIYRVTGGVMAEEACRRSYHILVKNHYIEDSGFPPFMSKVKISRIKQAIREVKCQAQN